jgi:hypothetical protein
MREPIRFAFCYGQSDLRRKSGATQAAKATLLHRDVRMLRAQDAQEQPFAGGRRSDV